MDPKDLIQGENVETPSDSQSGIITPDEGTQVNESAGTVSPEEATWNDLKGSTQERIQQLIREKNQERILRETAEAEARRAQFGGGVPTPGALGNPQLTPETQAAVKQLTGYGIADKDYVDQTTEQKINQKLSGLVYNMEIDRLSGRHNGGDGLPAFDKSEYEDYVTRYPQYRNYAPEDVYSKMYEDEIFEAKARNLGKAPQAGKPTSSLRPTKVRVQEETLTPESIETKLQSMPQPERQRWYEQNLDKINAVVGRIPSTE